jgi:hypothetical protein
MSQTDNFWGGLLLGTAVGGVVGGIVGVVVASKLSSPSHSLSDEAVTPLEGKADDKRSLRGASDKSIEAARQGLEDKIAQLNDAIDDVRQRLGGANGNPPVEDGERTFSQDS